MKGLTRALFVQVSADIFLKLLFHTKTILSWDWQRKLKNVPLLAHFQV